MRAEPVQVQIYEKLDPGVYFDKGIFNLVDATYGRAEGDTRKVARFFLAPADAALASEERIAWAERMISATRKADVWREDQGRCAICGEQSSLHFSGAQLRCTAHNQAIEPKILSRDGSRSTKHLFQNEFELRAHYHGTILYIWNKT